MEVKKHLLVMKIGMDKKFSKMKKKAISGVVATVIMIALVLAVVAIVWGVVTNLVEEQLEESGSCFNIFDKLELNSAYTCYNTSDNEFLFSLSVGDVEIDKVVVAVSGQGTTKSYTIENEESEIAGLLMYPGRETGIKAPGKNSGLTYISSDFSARPDSIRISPVVGNVQCEVSDSIQNIESCALLA